MSEDGQQKVAVSRLATASLILSLFVFVCSIVTGLCFYAFFCVGFEAGSKMVPLIILSMRIFFPFLIVLAPATPLLAIIAIARIKLSKGALCGYRRALLSMLIVGITVVFLGKWLAYVVSKIPNFPF